MTWALIFIHLSSGQPVQIDVIATVTQFNDCRKMVKIYNAEKGKGGGYYTCLGVNG